MLSGWLLVLSYLSLDEKSTHIVWSVGWKTSTDLHKPNLRAGIDIDDNSTLRLYKPETIQAYAMQNCYRDRAASSRLPSVYSSTAVQLSVA